MTLDALGILYAAERRNSDSKAITKKPEGNEHWDLTIVEALVFVTGVLLANRFTGATCVGCCTRPARVGILNRQMAQRNFRSK